MKTINISINNTDDINKFYKDIYKYKIFNSKDYLILNISKKINYIFRRELKQIEKAFNIKDKNKRLEYVYNTTCDNIDLYNKNNPCEFDNCGQCASQRAHATKSKINGCCGNCSHLKKNGKCDTKSLACKIFYCKYIKKKKDIFKYKDLKLANIFFTIPQMLVAKYNFFNTTEDNINLIKKNSILAFMMTKEVKEERF